MRLLCRLFGLGFVLVACVALFSQMLMMNIRRDELNVAISTAMSSTQVIMQEQIEDVKLGTSNRRKTISSNDEYVQEFITNFDKLVSTETDYTVKVYGVDYQKGLLDIGVEGKFKMLNGEYKTFDSRKTSIIEVIE